jgi:hypothetical protein
MALNLWRHRPIILHGSYLARPARKDIAYMAKRRPDMNKMMQQVQQMQADMAKAQEELAGQTVEASAGGGMVKVTASGSGDITAIKIDPEAVDPEDVELLEDMVLAAVNEAVRNSQELQESKLGGALGDLGDLGALGGLGGLPGS